MLLFKDYIGDSIPFAFHETKLAFPPNLSSIQQYLRIIRNVNVGSLTIIFFIFTVNSEVEIVLYLTLKSTVISGLVIGLHFLSLQNINCLLGPQMM